MLFMLQSLQQQKELTFGWKFTMLRLLYNTFIEICLRKLY